MRLRRHGVRIAIAVAAVSAPLTAVMLGSGTGLAATGTPVTAYGGTCGGAYVGWTNADQTVSAGTAITFANCKATLSQPGNHGLAASWTNLCSPAATNWQSQSAQSTVCTFSSPGTFYYTCVTHGSSMAGTITVTGAQPPPPTQSQPAPQPTQSHTAPPAYQPPAAAAPPPSPSPVPSPSPSDTSQALVGPSGSSSPGNGSLALATHPASSGGGPGAPLVIFVAVVLLGGAGAAVYFLRIRNA